MRITELRPKKRGRPLVLEKSLDSAVQKYIMSIREAGGIVNVAIVIAGARGLLQSMNRTMQILKQMNFKRRVGTTQAKISLQDFEQQRV